MHLKNKKPIRDIIMMPLRKFEYEEVGEGRLVINLGPQHPSTHGVLRLIAELDGERVKKVLPIIGYLHRGFEKIAEYRNYPMIVPLTDRLDYLSAMSNNMVYCQAIEELMSIKISERAEYIRVIVLELQRIASHLASVGFFGNDVGITFTAMMYTFRERELIINLFETLSGARLTYNYIRIGGLREDLPPGFENNALRSIDIIEKKVDEYEEFFSENEIFLRRTQGIGVLKLKDAINLGATGPVLRGSGLKSDVRVTDPYTIYDRFDWDIITEKKGDCFARYNIWINEIRQSISIVRQALKGLPKGEINVKIPRVIKPESGEVYSKIESPRGELAMNVISDGTLKPYRLKIRSPAFCNLSLLPIIAEEGLIADLIATLGSIDPVFGEVDR
jgi:NADH-quinone oxidoreductase subunit D|tara:strand:+ start:2119 stop:3288 length:1170 start_codon:yes stop_codon:yes gene_type:complete